MAIVRNKNNIDSTIDKPYCTHNRAMAGSPNAAFTPQYVGEIVLDTTNKVRWQAKAADNGSWVPLEAEVT